MLTFAAYRQHIDKLFAAALEAAEPGRAVRRAMERRGRTLHLGAYDFDLREGRVFVVSVGKAALPMAHAALEIIADELHAALIIGKTGALERQDLGVMHGDAVKVMGGNHPVSGPQSIEATSALLARLAEASADDLVLCLISGGASALLTQPLVPLDDWQQLTQALLASGCTINELNTVRRQLDRVKGGGLARVAAPAACVSLILSDVVGNPLEAIGSGPTYVISERPGDAVQVLERYQIAQALGEATYERIVSALRKEDHAPGLEPQVNEIIIVGDVRKAAEAVAAEAKGLGFVPQILTVHLEGEAREVGRVAAAIAIDTPPGRCFILGGETTVTLRGDGRGGRNLETALAAAMGIVEWPRVAVASLATDGEDGPTPVAGAAVAGWTVPVAAERGLSPDDYLARNDSFSFFTQLDAASRSEDAPFPPCLVVPGSTGTNVNDLLLILTYEE